MAQENATTTPEQTAVALSKKHVRGAIVAAGRLEASLAQLEGKRDLMRRARSLKRELEDFEEEMLDSTSAAPDRQLELVEDCDSILEGD